MGDCQYHYTDSELYQRGAMNETHCGARTWPAYEQRDETYLHPVDNLMHIRTVTVPREDHDPFCPEHGGTPSPADFVRDAPVAVAPAPIRDDAPALTPAAPVTTPFREPVTSLSGTPDLTKAE
jgi:hypothetical protein